MSRVRLAGVAAVGGAAVLWGTTGTAATFATEVSPLALGAAGLGIGGLLQAILAARGLSRAVPQLRPHIGLILLGSLAVAMYPLAFYSSMHLAGVAVGTVVSLASAPLVSALLERHVDGRRMSPRWGLAAGLGIAGSTLLCVSRMTGSPSDTGPILAGVALGLLAGTSYASYSWTVRRLMGCGIARATAMGAVFGCGGVLLIPVWIATGAPLLGSTENLLVIAYLVLVPMFLGYVAFGYGLARVAATTATTLTLAEPAVATVLAVLVVGERFTGSGWLGLGIIGIGLLILIASPERARPELSPQRAITLRSG